jgi:hypothetical protein
VTALEFSKLVKNPRRRADGKWWDARCPAHADDRPSLSFSDGETALVVECHRKCTLEAIAAAVGRPVSDFFRDQQNGRQPGRRLVATYNYCDERGELLYQVCRYDPKDFRVRRPNGTDGWTWSLDGVRVVPYRLPELAEAQRVWIPEGEKDVDTLAGLGLVATCNHGGAGKWREEHIRALVAAAVPEVVVLRDNDRPGAAHQASVASSCAAGLPVKCLQLPGLPPLRDKHGEDVTDWIEAGHTVAELQALADAAPLFDASSPPSPSASSLREPIISAEGDDYRATWPDDGVEVLAVAPRESGEGIHAEVTVSRDGVVLSWGRLNLASTAMREGLVKKLNAAVPEAWRERLELACRLVAERVRTGTPVITLTPSLPDPGGPIS